MYDAEKYRSKEEVAKWRQRDPIDLFTIRLRAEGLLDDAALASIEASVKDEVDQAVREAEEGPLEAVADLEKDVYVRPRP
jgi:pyruvate dehydrogenase E1 component alpha subunit